MSFIRMICTNQVWTWSLESWLLKDSPIYALILFWQRRLDIFFLCYSNESGFTRYLPRILVSCSLVFRCAAVQNERQLSLWQAKLLFDWLFPTLLSLPALTLRTFCKLIEILSLFLSSLTIFPCAALKTAKGNSAWKQRFQHRYRTFL